MTTDKVIMKNPNYKNYNLGVKDERERTLRIIKWYIEEVSCYDKIPLDVLIELRAEIEKG